MNGIGLVRALGAAALALVIGVVATPSAAGHSSQTGSSPAVGAVLDAAPSIVEVTFDTPLMDVGAALVVRSEEGTVISEPSPEVARNVIRTAVSPDAPPGTYVVAYRVVSQDGHPITATFDYTVAGDATAPTAPGSLAPSPPAEAVTAALEEPDGPPNALIAGGLLVLTLIVAGAIALRR